MVKFLIFRSVIIEVAIKLKEKSYFTNKNVGF